MQSYQGVSGQGQSNYLICPPGYVPVYYSDGSWEFLPAQNAVPMQYGYQEVAQQTENVFFQHIDQQVSLRPVMQTDHFILSTLRTLDERIEYVDNHQIYIDLDVFRSLISKTTNGEEILGLISLIPPNALNSGFIHAALWHCQDKLIDDRCIFFLYDMARDQGIMSWITCIVALETARDHMNTYKLLEIFNENPSFRSSKVYALVIKYLGNSDNYESAKKIYHYLEPKERSIDVNNVMISIADRNDDYHFAKWIYYHIPIRMHDDKIISRIIAAAGKNRDYTFAKEVFDKSEVREEKIYGSYIRTAYRSNNVNEARNVFETLPEDYKKNQIIIKIVISSEIRLGNIDYAVRVYDSLSQPVQMLLKSHLFNADLQAINEYKKGTFDQSQATPLAISEPIAEDEDDEYTRFLITRNGPPILDYHDFTLDESFESFNDFVLGQNQGFAKCFVHLNPTIPDGLLQFKDQVAQHFPNLKCCFSIYDQNRLIVEAKRPIGR